MLTDLAPIFHASSTRATKVSLCVDPGKRSAVLKLGFIRTSLFLHGFMFKAFMDDATADLRSSVLKSATRILGLAIVKPPGKPNNIAPPVIPEYFRNSLLLMPVMSLFCFSVDVLLASVFMIAFSVYEDSVTGNLPEGAKAHYCHQVNRIEAFVLHLKEY
jgi:hypothetical protein